MSYTLGQAARVAQRSKPTIARAIQRGRLSAFKTEDGSYRIDPAELFRVYPGDGQTSGTMQQSVPVTPTRESLRVERDRLLSEREDLRETIRDLRIRLDASEAERRELSAQVRGLLTVRTDIAATDAIAPDTTKTDELGLSSPAPPGELERGSTLPLPSHAGFRPRWWRWRFRW